MFVLGGGAVSLATACATQQVSIGGRLEPGAITALAFSSAGHAEALELSSDGIIHAAGDNANPAWLTLAADGRAAARTLRLLADYARAVMRMRRQSLDEPSGLVSDGFSILRPGESLLRQTQALDDQISLLRVNATGNDDLLTALDALALDVAAAEGDARTAVQQGTLLVERGRQLARSLGEKLE